MLTSVFKEIQDYSIEGVKIKPGTPVDENNSPSTYFSSIVLKDDGSYQGRLDIVSDDSSVNCVTVRQISDFGRVIIRDSSGNNILKFDASTGNTNYINRSLLIKGESASQNETTFPLQIISGGIWSQSYMEGSAFRATDSSDNLRGYLDAQSGYGNLWLYNNSGTVTARILTGTGESFINGIVVLGNSASFESTSTYPTQVGSGFSVLGATKFLSTVWFTNNISLTTGKTFTIAGVTPAAAQWGYLNTMQDVATTASPTFANIQSNGSFGAKVGFTPGNINTSTTSYFHIVYQTAPFTVTLQGTNIDQTYIIQNAAATGSITLSPATNNSISAGPTALAPGESVIISCRYYGGLIHNWYGILIS